MTTFMVTMIKIKREIDQTWICGSMNSDRLLLIALKIAKIALKGVTNAKDHD